MRKEAGEIYNQVADDDLEDLGLCASSPSECLLEECNKDVTEWGRDNGPVKCHLRHTRSEVGPMLRAVLRDD